MTRFSLSIKATLTALLGVFLLGWGTAQAQVTVSLPTVTAQVGSTPDLPITVSDLTGLNVTSYEFTLAYDPTFIRITGVSVSGTLSAVAGAFAPEVNLSVPGQITVSYASPTALTGAGTLLNLEASYDSRGTSPLSFNSFMFNEGTPAVVTVAGSAIVPTLAIIIDDGNVGTMGIDTMVPVRVDDLTGLGVFSYEFVVSYDATVINVTGVSLAGTISEGAGAIVQTNTATTGQIDVSVARNAAITGDGTLIYLLVTPTGAGDSDMDFASFMFNEGTPTGQTINGSITISANGAPVFTSSAADATIWELDTFTATFAATDPEGNAVTLSLTAGAGVANSSFDATTGAFTFTPDLTQAGSYTFTVTASDGAITSTATWMVDVLNYIEGFEAGLYGVNVVPFVATPASGFVTFVLDEGANTLEVAGTAFDLSGAYSAAHVHVGMVGETGGVALPLDLTALSGDNRSVGFDVVAYDLTADLLGGMSAADFIAALKAGGLYVNLHSAAYSGGEIRGQILDLGNAAPAATSARAPGSYTIAGSGTDNAFNVSWLSANDPDGDTVNYIFQMSMNSAFSDVVSLDHFGDDNGFSLTVEDAAMLYDQLTGGSPGNVNIGGSVTVYHRVITTDGSRWTAGPAKELTLTRGTVTANEDEVGIPTEFTLSGNYPNPFNPSTSIRFDLPENAEVSVTVVDMLGRTVMTVPTQQFTAGAARTMQLNAGSLASGQYVYRIVARGAQVTHTATGMLTLLK